MQISLKADSYADLAKFCVLEWLRHSSRVIHIKAGSKS